MKRIRKLRENAQVCVVVGHHARRGLICIGEIGEISDLQFPSEQEMPWHFHIYAYIYL